MAEIVLFGDVNVDVLMSIPKYPEPGGDAMAKHVTVRPGGSVANTAIVLSKLGVPVKLIGRVGDDFWAKTAKQPLIEHNVDISAVTLDSVHSTGLIFIPVTTDGERTMFSYRGANIQKPPEEIEPDLFKEAKLLHISSYNLLEDPQREATYKALEIASGFNLGVSMDVGVEPALKIKDDLDALLPGMKLVVLGMDEAQRFVNERTPQTVAEKLLRRGVSMIGLKLGPQGCLIASSDGFQHLPGLEVDTVDTTGAGDAFCAGLLYGQCAGLGTGESGLLANLLGALATTVWGSGPALPARVELVRYLLDNEKFFERVELMDLRDRLLELFGDSNG